ncbi:1-phosphofructokinase family hexose kinase [Maribacter sp. ACAM166]|uniref:1-phosphofructokinase family hexose kinase n=1 Tax=Maribacter sp. ACAM166 TaxID=2508996 RepID=UPI0010FE0BC6|nr:1-phosphofructokinase family hexose kinase [Maribacter sp. ACAM166]TLP81785.1 1-phosphofructokinase family hexose kinase [Maribacter sp. ACAM166]
MHRRIITLTLNPTIDKSTTVVGISPNSKLRCTEPTYDAGGGGINVSCAIKKLGGDSLGMYLAGGPTGNHLKQLLDKDGIEQSIIKIEGWTRDNLAVTDTVTNQQYRFGMPGPNVKKEEWEAVLKQLEDYLQESDYLIASGKLPPGIPDDFYVQVAAIARKKKARFILDTSGEALMKAAAHSHIYILKPNLGELAALCGVPSISALELEILAKKFLAEHDCEALVVSLGAKGALLATKYEMEYVPAPTVLQKSTIGAGDSMVAGMVMSLIWGKSFSDMVKYGVACGTAATMHEGTKLCNKDDADKLYEWIRRAQTVKK